MDDAASISIFVDETFVDELWTLATRDPLAVEKAQEVSAKLTAKRLLDWAIFGNGWLVT